jgi:4-hydroxybenzoyl-CoA thioesterase
MVNMILNPLVLTSRRTVRIAWGDCDAAGIVYFPRYFEWFDAGTHALFDKAGLSFARMSEQYPGVAIPVVSTRATFIRSSTYGDEVAIDTEIVRWGRSSFDVHHRLLRGEELAVECFETRVWVVKTGDNRLEGQAVPPEVIARFQMVTP